MPLISFLKSPISCLLFGTKLAAFILKTDAKSLELKDRTDA